MNEVMRASHQIVSAAKKLGIIKYPEDSLCQTCGDKKTLVAHHWNGNENPLDLWFVCHSCNKVLPNGGLTLEQARERCDYKNYPKRRLQSYITYMRQHQVTNRTPWKDMADELYPLLTENQKEEARLFLEKGKLQE